MGIRHVAKSIRMSSLWQVIRSYALDPTPKLCVKISVLTMLDLDPMQRSIRSLRYIY